MKRKVPIGRVGSLMPSLPRRTARATAETVASCPTIREVRVLSRFLSLFSSSSVTFVTGIPVHSVTTAATSASVTRSDSSEPPDRLPFFFSSSALVSVFSSSRNFAARSKSCEQTASSLSLATVRSRSSMARSSGDAADASIRTFAAASSMRSMALSGRKRSGR